jgi:hypothetical protein
MIQDEVCLPPQEEDECLSPDVLLHIAYDVVSQLDNAADFWQLSLEELSLQDFLVEQIDSLQPVVEAQVDHATHLSQDTIESVHAPWPSQPNAASFGRLYGARRVLMGRLSSIAVVPLAIPGRSCFHLPDRGQSRHGMLRPCLISLSSLLPVATMVACTLTPSQKYVPRLAEWS